MFQKLKGLLLKQKSAIRYTAGSAFNSLAQIVSSIIILAYIKPDNLGLWNALLLFETYALFLQAGVINGLNREVPFYLGKNDKKQAESLASSALFFFLISMILCLFVGIGFLIYNHNQESIFKVTFIGILFITINKFYENYLSSTFRSNHSFDQLAGVYFLRGIFLIVSTLLVVYYGYNGYIIRMVSTSLLVSLLLHIIRPMKVKPSFNLENIKLLLKVGTPIFVLAYIFTTSSTIDRVLLIKYTNFETVGHYALGLMVLSSFKVLPTSLANYIYPKMSFAFGRSNDAKDLMKKALKINLIVFGIMFPIAIAGYFLLPIIIPILFPKYIDGIIAAQILLFAAVLSGASIGANVFWSLKIWKYITISQLSGALFNIVLIYAGIKLFSNPILGVSLGVLMSQFCYFTLINLMVYIYGNHKTNLAKQEG